MVGYEKKTFWIFMHFNENIRNDEKIAEKSRGYAYKIRVMLTKLIISHLLIVLEY